MFSKKEVANRPEWYDNIAPNLFFYELALIYPALLLHQFKQIIHCNLRLDN